MTFDALRQDLRFALRAFARRPAFTAVALATLTIGIAATTAVFSVLNGVLFRSLPGVATDGRVVEIARDRDGDLSDLSYPFVQTVARESRTLDAVAAVDWSPLSVGGAERPEVRVALGVTASYFDVLGVRASRGRLFAPEEATYPSVRAVAVISEELRTSRMADQEIPGASLIVNGVPLTVVGVAGGGFRGHAIAPVDVFVPLGLAVPGLHSAEALTDVTSEDVQMIGRLRAGASARAAREELDALGAAALASGSESGTGGFRARVDPWGPVPAAARSYVAAFLSAMLLLTALVLAMACSNVAGLALSRSAERTDEIGVRVALGAGRGRIARQLLTEGAVLAVGAAALAIPIAMWIGRLLLVFEPPLPAGFDLALDFSLDWRVVAFAFAAALGSSVVFNLAPALHAARADVVSALKAGAGRGGPRRSWTRGALVAGQMALSLVLMVTAGLFLRSVAAMRTVDPGWNADGVYVADLDLELTGTEREEGAAFFRGVAETTARVPGVAAVGLAHKLPLASSSSFGDVRVDGLRPPEGRQGFPASALRVSPGYFRTLDLTLLQGRDFAGDDGPDAAAVAIVNRTMAARLWPEGSALGQVFHVGRSGNVRDLTVVGVVEDARYRSLFETTPSFYYVPLEQWYDAHMFLLVKTDPARADDVRAGVRQVVGALQPNLPVEPLSPLESKLALSLAPQRIAAWVSGALGLLGLLLGSVGVYGVTAYAVGRRAREIGIRIALGATRGDVLLLVLRQGMAAPLVGVAVGLLGAAVVARLVAAFLSGVGITDPAAVGGAVLLLLLVAFSATFVPAWKVARGRPVESLRAG